MYGMSITGNSFQGPRCFMLDTGIMFCVNVFFGESKEKFLHSLATF